MDSDSKRTATSTPTRPSTPTNTQPSSSSIPLKKKVIFTPSQYQSPPMKKIFQQSPTQIVENKSSEIQDIVNRIKKRQMENLKDFELLETQNRMLRARNKELMFQLNLAKKAEEDERFRY